MASLRGRSRSRVPTIAASIGWVLGAPLAATAATCPSAGTQAAIVNAVAPRLELRLADGRLVRLAGVEPAAASPAEPDLAETTRADLAARLVGRPVTVLPLAAAPDRWGRIPSIVFATNDEPGGLAARVVAAGAGRYLPEAVADGCREALLTAEGRARDARLGLWRDPYYGVLAVDDRSGFIERSATFVLAEGRLTGVTSSPYRTTLRFAPSPGQSHMGHMLVATIAPRTVRRFEMAGWDMQSLVGRRLRFRGLLDLRFGPRIELKAPDQVEVLDAPAGPVPRTDAAPRAAN